MELLKPISLKFFSEKDVSIVIPSNLIGCDSWLAVFLASIKVSFPLKVCIERYLTGSPSSDLIDFIIVFFRKF